MPSADPVTARAGADEPGSRAVWSALLAAARRAREAAPPDAGAYAADPDTGVRAVPAASPDALIEWRPRSGWTRAAAAPAAWHALLDLYLPICNASARAPLTVGHLGQGLDGYIATSTGDSNYVTGPENILHLHRMRSLCDAVLVGAGTVASDDPRLTARRAPGANPVRVVLDPRRRLAPTHGVFCDGAATTLVVCDAARAGEPGERVGDAEILGVPLGPAGLDLEALLAALHARGLQTIFVEGGGKTVSAFLEHGLLDRLQVAVAPLVTGDGRRGLRLGARQRMGDCLRLAHRVFAMGDDVLFDCDLRNADAPAAAGAPAAGTVRRIR